MAALGAIPGQLDERFLDVVELLLDCPGHVVVSGAGTSSTVAARLAHLLTVCGAPAFHLHPGDAAHGASATLRAGDVLLAVSKGGESDELTALVQVARHRGVPVVAVTQDLTGTLSQLADHRLVYEVPDQIDAGGSLALGSSLAAGLVGDALCHAVLAERGLDPAELARTHPGGAVGKALRAGAGS